MTMKPRTVPVELRPAEARDVEAIQRVAREAWNQVYSGLFGAAERQRVLEHSFSRRALLEDLGRHSSYFFVAAADGGVVGFAELVIDGRCGELVRVVVMPEWQRRGIASALLRRGFAVLAAAGASAVTAAVEPEDEACRALFERHGFESAGEPLSDLDDLGGGSMELAEFKRPLDDLFDRAAGDEPPPEATVWVELADGPRAADGGRGTARGFTVLATADESRLSFARSALEGAGIVYTLHADPSGDRDEEVTELRVARARVDEARDLLDTLDSDDIERAADE